MNYPTGFDAKDARRIENMAVKAHKQYPDSDDRADEKMQALAHQMAKAIQKADKAVRRANAAENENYHAVASIFFARYNALLGR